METLWPVVSETVALTADEVHVWAVPLACRGALDELWAILSSDERRRAGRFRFDLPRQRFIVARARLRALLGRYLNVVAAEIALTEGANGKPRLAPRTSATPLYFNVAHSGELALIAVVAGCEVGVDVERLRPIRRWEEISSRYFHADDIRAILATAALEQPKAFLQCWTGKEAVLKAIGTGLSGPLTSFHVPIDEQVAHWLQVPFGEPATAIDVWLQRLEPHRDYAAAVAVAGEKRRVRCYTFAC
jgi:4'-phosphopantetheinyl transferase